jgi:putative ABC transport system permease protein
MPLPDEKLPSGVRRAFHLPFTSRRRARQELDEELAFHFDMAVSELEAAGTPPHEARRLARERFGDFDEWHARLMNEDHRRNRRVRRRDRWEALSAEALRLVRSLASAPVFTIGVVLTLAIGIGANATMFGIVDRLLLRAPEGVADADNVRRVWVRLHSQGEVHNNEYLSYPLYRDIRDQVPAFQSVGAWSLREVVSGTGTDVTALRAGLVTGDYFNTLGTQPALGRLFVYEEGEIGTPADVVVLSHGLWQLQYGGRKDVIGETITIGGRPMTIIGVLPEGVGSLTLGKVDVWVPMSSMSVAGMPGDPSRQRNWTWLRVVGRLAPGATDADLSEQLTLVMVHNERERGRDDEALARLQVRGSGWGIQAAAGPERSTSVSVAKWLAGMSVVLLLIACANVANLMLVRAMRRERETAVRVALGVSPRRLAVHAVAESALVALLGGGVALLLARWAGSLVRTMLLPEMQWPDRVMDARVAAITTGAIVVTTLLAGLAPALRAVRVDVLPSLQGGQRGGTLRPSRMRSALLVSQAALCVLLLVGAGLFLRSLHSATGLDLGYRPGPVAVVSLSLHRSGVDREEQPLVVERAREALERVPGVVSVARTNSVPHWSSTTFGISVPGLDSIPMDRGYPYFHSVSPEYFSTMGVSLVRGRLFTASDASAQVALVNETAARMLWPGEDALGHCVRIGTADSVPCLTVVGIVGDMRWNGVSEHAPMQIYAPQENAADTPLYLLVRLAQEPHDGPGAIEFALREAAMSVDSRLDWAGVETLTGIVAPDYRSWRLGATMFTAFGLLALLLASIGLYSVISYMVAQRTHEMGVRLALGASRGRVARMVVRQGVALVGVGAALGVVVALAASGRLESLLFDVPPRDPVVLGIAAGTLLLVAAVACAIPAVKAARVNPVEALKD